MQAVRNVVFEEARPGSWGAVLELARAVCLEERLGERPPDAHRLSDRLHLRPERLVRTGELLEREPRELDDDVVERRLEARGSRPSQVVGDLVQRVADGELGGDLRDRIPGRFDASADERETRGFISMTRSAPVSRSRANWMFEPPVSTPPHESPRRRRHEAPDRPRRRASSAARP